MPLFSSEKLKEIKAREMPAIGRPRVLLVDDEPANLRMMAALLEREFELLEAPDGQAAWELIQSFSESESLACIVSDQRMPRLTGVELFERVHPVMPRVVRIIVTGFVDVDAIIDSINKAEIYKFIVKPFDANDFKLTVKRAIEAYEMQRRLDAYHRELEAHNIAFRRFVPGEFLEHLDRPNILEVQLGDNAMRDMTVLFADVIDFSSLSEHMQPHENFRFLNSYLSRVGPIIRNHSGFVDKYLGDGVMGLFPHSRRHALDTALDFRRDLVEYNAGRARAGYRPIDVGVGIHCGVLLLGTIGESQRMDTTVIADGVNVASRLESLTRIYRTGIIVSANVTSRLSEKDPYSLRPLGRVRVKGREADVEIFELFDADEPSLAEHKLRTTAAFTTALHAYQHGDFETAGRLFEEITALHPNDGPAAFYRARCTALTLNAPAEWSGIEIFETK
jgi:two-component system, sensor histidine kinase ChiS